MVKFPRIACSTLIVVAICLGSHEADADSFGNWIILEVGRVQVKPTRANGTQWDTRSADVPDCGIFGLFGSVAGGAVGGGVGAKLGSALATHLCGGSVSKQQKRDPSAPDIIVELVAGNAIYYTPVALDSYDESFNYQFAVPLDGVPANGIALDVRDYDGNGKGERIGMVRLTRDELEQAFEASPPAITRSDARVSSIEISVLPYPMPTPHVRMTYQANQDVATTSVQVHAGDLLTISANGQYSVADNGELIDVRGYTNGAKQDYDYDEFQGVNHGEAIAAIQDPTGTFSTLVVGNCIAAMAPQSGTVSVGINDRDRGNNAGAVNFDVRVELPSIEQWQAGGTYACRSR